MTSATVGDMRQGDGGGTTSQKKKGSLYVDSNDDDVDDHECSKSITTTMPEDVLLNVMRFLDVPSLLRMRYLNRSFRTLASRNSAGWDNLCAVLWRDKVHVAVAAKTLVENDDAMKAYELSLADARDRQYITRSELCYDPITHKGTVWSFRFKEAAGRDWTSSDPWFNYQPCRKLVLLEDGTVKMYVVARSSSTTFLDGGGGYHTISDGDRRTIQGDGVPELMDPSFQDRDVTAPNDADGNEERHSLRDPPSPMTWRFLNQPLDMPVRPLGSYVRFNVAGRDVPTYCCRRSPTKNWGFVMESCWGVYTSFEPPPRPQHLRRMQQARERRRRRRIIRRVTGVGDTELHVAFVVLYDDDDDVDDDDDHVNDRNEDRNNSNNVYPDNAAGHERNNDVRNDNSNNNNNNNNNDDNTDILLVDDEQFQIDSRVQWREAQLYNLGAQVLPEGEVPII